METIVKKAFKEGCEKLFESTPTLKSFGWHQYTPDGDECVFGAHTAYPTINGLDEYEKDVEIDEELSKSVKEFLRTLDNEDYKILFGDHVTVKVTPK